MLMLLINILCVLKNFSRRVETKTGNRQACSPSRFFLEGKDVFIFYFIFVEQAISYISRIKTPTRVSH